MAFYLLLFLTLMCSVIFAKNANKAPRYYWCASLPVIIAYCTTYGFRDGWAIDYNVYYKLYEGLFSHVSIDEYEYLFRNYIRLLTDLGFPYSFFLISVSAITIIAQLFLLKENKKIILYALPIFLLITIYQSANLIRYFMAISILNIGLYFLLKKKMYVFIGLSLISILIHTGTIILIPIILIFYKWNVFNNVRWTFVIYILSFVFGSISQYVNSSSINVVQGFVTFVLSFIGGDNQLSKYQDASAISDVLLGSRDKADISIFYYIFHFIFATCFIFMGDILKKLMGNIHNICFFYNICVFALILENLSLQTEILTRIDIYFLYLIYIPLGYIFYFYKKNTLLKSFMPFLTISLLYIIFSSFKSLQIFELNYIWD